MDKSGKQLGEAVEVKRVEDGFDAFEPFHDDIVRDSR